jgi:1,4-dihydroxy-2-naphthoyl-CoA synthase
MATRMQQRRGTAAQWISTNDGDGPILNAGEIGYETDTNKFKVGDGVNHWVDLNYFLDAVALGGSIDDYIPLTDKGAVNGVAAGAGANIALACDIVVASENASFIQAFSKIGLIPDSAGTFFLPRLIGFQKATALMMLGDKVSAEEALNMGMIYKIFPTGLFDEEVMTLATTLAQMPTKAIGLTKRLLNQSMTNNLEQQLALESDLQIEASSSNDYKEGVTAFVEKRKPEFKGN